MKYEVIIPWFGVSRGDVVELKQLHPALKVNVRLMRGEAVELVPATPDATAQKRGRSAKAETTPDATE